MAPGQRQCSDFDRAGSAHVLPIVFVLGATTNADLFTVGSELLIEGAMSNL